MGHPVTHRRGRRSYLDAAAGAKPLGLPSSHGALGRNPLGRKPRTTHVARVFKFVDIFGCELHTITDPKDKLPIPANAQQVSIGPMTMRVESVRTVGQPQNTYRLLCPRPGTNSCGKRLALLLSSMVFGSLKKEPRTMRTPTTLAFLSIPRSSPINLSVTVQNTSKSLTHFQYNSSTRASERAVDQTRTEERI